MKITIVGYGFVGRAFQSILQPHYDVKVVDPKYNTNQIDDDSEAVVVCVSTPEGWVVFVICTQCTKPCVKVLMCPS